METELIKTLSHIILGTSAVLTAIAVVIKSGKVFAEYVAKKKALLEDIDNIKKEQKMTFKALSACLDGLEQLGCNHTVTETKKELEDWLISQAHD